MEYKEVQKIAKDTIEYAKKNIYAGMSLIEIREMCERKMLELGADSFWYWDIGAFVFAGDETTISVSGTKYKTSDRVILENDIITIDLSPQRENIWGDYARTLIIENGIVVDDEFASNEEWKNGVGSALLEYAQGTGNWDGVVTAFVDGWASEYAAANN